MCDSIVHRGPDDEGIFIEGNFGMGMRRLSIIDLDTGHQPISNEDESLWVVLNGEIYNYVELRVELEKKGHKFKTKSDTEVLLHLYEEYGIDFVQYLRGMFGFALWDKKKQELLLARDQMGVKQIYFYNDGKKLIFGSEIKTILKVLDKKPAVNFKAFYYYLAFSYFPDDITIYENIFKVMPGHVLRIKQNRIEDVEFWNLNRIEQNNMDFEEAQKGLLAVLREAMALNLRSDVPLGIFLSGGIDSSIITAIAAEITDKPLNTFTIGYGKEGGFYDERQYARIVAKRFKTNHHEYVVNPDIEKAIIELIGYFDEPFTNSSAIPTYYISKVMSQNVKVALSGLGGDEIAAGYERYAGLKVLQKFNNLPFALKKIAGSLVNSLPDSKDGSYFSIRCKRFIQATGFPPEQAYYNLVAASHKKQDQVISAKFRTAAAALNPYNVFLDLFRKAGKRDIVNSLMYFDMYSYTLNDLLVLSDRTSMAASLEVRVPLYDHKLVEYVFGLPADYKLRGLEKKYILKKAFEGILPRQILYRKKQGFSTPLAVWLRNDLLRFAREVLSSKRIEATEVLDLEGTQSLLEEHLSRKANNQGLIFALMTFILWHEKFVQGLDITGKG